MKIKNNERYITNKQLNKIIKFLGNEYIPKQIIICENRLDILKLGFINCLLLFVSLRIIPIILGKIEGSYNHIFNRVCIFIFAQDYDDYNYHSKQFYSLHALLHELRHHYQYVKRSGISELDADYFATKFLNTKSKKIKEIMGWRNEWKVEEED